MTPQETNRRIAEHLGWTNILPPTGNPIGVIVGGDKNNPLDWLTIPDFCSSLDAMAQAEEIIYGRDLCKEYSNALLQIVQAEWIVDKRTRGFMVCAATASQRARAFLSVVSAMSVEQTTP